LVALILLLASAAPGLDDLFDPFSAAFPGSGDRIKRKQAAFEEHLARRGPAVLFKAMQRCDPAVEEVVKKRDAMYGRFSKAHARYAGWMEDYAKKYRRKHGRDPADFPMPESLNKGYLDQELAMKAANSLVERELGFHRWALERLARAAPEADERFKAALEAGLRAKSPHQRLRAARLLALVPGWDPAAAFARERHPAVAAALAPGAAALDHESWVVRAGGVAVLRGRRTKESVDALVARWPKEQGRSQDDLHDALAWLTNRVESDWPAWWQAASAGFQPSPPPPAAPPQPDRVVPPISPSGRACFALPTGSERFVLCVGTARGWAEIQKEINRFLATVPESAEFALVAFGAGAEPFKRGLVANSGTNREALAKWMEKREPGARNDLWTGMDAAFGIAEEGSADTLILFNPGPPTQIGDSPALVTSPRQIWYELSYRNALLGVRVLGYGASGGGDSYFLQELAREQRGGFIAFPSER